MCFFLIPLFNMIYHSMPLSSDEIDSLYNVRKEEKKINYKNIYIDLFLFFPYIYIYIIFNTKINILYFFLLIYI